jgi:imidazolonepropionase-like amidohydrolase
MGYKRELEVASETLRKMHKRGIRILPGGDYGFAWLPHGTNANDLQYFVDYIGMTPKETLLSATKLGGEIMMRPHELGQIREGFIADIVLVDGNPLSNLGILTNPAKISLVMKEGVIYKEMPSETPKEAALDVPSSESPTLDEGVRQVVHA